MGSPDMGLWKRVFVEKCWKTLIFWKISYRLMVIFDTVCAISNGPFGSKIGFEELTFLSKWSFLGIIDQN